MCVVLDVLMVAVVAGRRRGTGCGMLASRETVLLWLVNAFSRSDSKRLPERR